MIDIISISLAVLGTLLTIYGLYLTKKSKSGEIKDRESLVKEWLKNAKNAKNAIFAISYSVGIPEKKDDETKLWKEYLKVIEEKKSIDTKFDARLIGPKRPDRIKSLYERKKSGFEVRVNNDISKYDFRFQICDKSVVLLNVPSTEGDSMKSESGIEIKAKLFVNFCLNKFEEEWKNKGTKSLDDFIEKEILNILPYEKNEHTGLNLDSICNKLQLPRNICKEYLDKLIRDKKSTINSNGEYYGINFQNLEAKE